MTTRSQLKYRLLVVSFHTNSQPELSYFFHPCHSAAVFISFHFIVRFQFLAKCICSLSLLQNRFHGRFLFRLRFAALCNWVACTISRLDAERTISDECRATVAATFVSLFRLITMLRLHTILADSLLLPTSDPFDFITRCNYSMVFSFSLRRFQRSSVHIQVD